MEKCKQPNPGRPGFPCQQNVWLWSNLARLHRMASWERLPHAASIAARLERGWLPLSDSRLSPGPLGTLVAALKTYVQDTLRCVFTTQRKGFSSWLREGQYKTVRGGQEPGLAGWL